MTDSADITVLTGIVYTERDARPLALDLYLPSQPTVSVPAPVPVPVLVYLHGGAWITGSRDETPARLAGLARAGIAVASIDYTFVQDAPFPAQREDIVDALAWLVGNAARYGLDPARVALGGASAGGHLALLTAIALTDGSAPGGSLPGGLAITGMVSLFASSDLTSAKPLVDRTRGLEVPAMIAAAPLPAVFHGAHPSPGERAALLIGVPENEVDEEMLARHSPIHRLHADAPPALLLHGTADAMVSHEHSVRFRDAALRAGLSAELDLVDGANHEGPEFDDPAIASRIAGFVAGHSSEVTHV